MGKAIYPSQTGRYLNNKLLVAVDVSTSDRFLCISIVTTNTTIVEDINLGNIGVKMALLASFVA
jgi:hypothetical protein